jgi:hypothetical protein
MSTSDFVFGAGILLVVLLQIWLTVRVWKSTTYERSQKILQSKLIWLLPIVGAVLVFSLMPREDDFPPPRSHLKS